MRRLFFILFFIPSLASGTDYYVKTSGNDSNTGLSDAQAWKTISKVNTVWNAGTFAPGDHIYFNRGDEFYGTIEVKESGTAVNPIVVSAYGSGNDPVITGFTTIISGWSSYGGGIYYQTQSSESTPNVLLIDGVNTPLGRWPDASVGYRTLSTASNSELTDNSLPASPDYTGGVIVIKTVAWVIEKRAITNQEYTTFYYSPTVYDPQNGNGYFIQNHIACLTTFGEWEYESGTLYMYFGGANPNSYVIKMSSLDNGIEVNGYNYVTFDNLTIEGANQKGIYTNNADYITIQNCKIQNCGADGINGSSSCQYNIIQDNVFYNCNNVAINGDETYYTIQRNYIKNTGYLVGMGGNGNQDYSGIICRGNNGLITYNKIINCGYDGLAWGGTDTEISYNVIDYSCLHKDDGGGLYTYRDYNTGKVVKYNIILNSQASNEGYATEEWDRAHGIYNDGAYNITYSNNTCAGNWGAGIMMNAAKSLTVRSNTCYDNSTQIFMLSEPTDIGYSSGHVIDTNLMIAKTYDGDWRESSFRIALLGTSDWNDFGTSDYNIFAYPTTEASVYIDTWFNAWEWRYNNRVGYTLAGWQGLSGLDANSSTYPFAYSESNIHFIYNDTTYNRTWNVSATMHDVEGNAYSGNTVLAPFTSLVLIGAGTVTETGGGTVVIPTVVTSSAIVNGTTVYTGGNVTDDGNGSITVRGVCYALTTNPTTADDYVLSGTGTGAFSTTLSGLLQSTFYYCRAFATNSAGTAYGSNVTFTTGTVPSVTHGLWKHANRLLKRNGELWKR